jgi:hypothetical protein
MNKGICKTIEAKISEAPITYDDLCKHFKQYSRANISAAICTINRGGMLGKEGSQRNRIYFRLDQPRPVVKPKTSSAAPTAYKPSVFVGKLGKVPHFIDPRRDYREAESLAMLTRAA